MVYPMQSPPKNPTLAAILSFLLNGLGQIYNGQIGKGLVIILLQILNGLLATVMIGFITFPIIWIWSIFDAYQVAQRINREAMQQPMTNLKPCPRCAERVMADAQVCRYCGLQFFAGGQPVLPAAAQIPAAFPPPYAPQAPVSQPPYASPPAFQPPYAFPALQAPADQPRYSSKSAPAPAYQPSYSPSLPQPPARAAFALPQQAHPVPAARFCPECGQAVRDIAKFCMHCGVILEPRRSTPVER